MNILNNEIAIKCKYDILLSFCWVIDKLSNTETASVELGFVDRFSGTLIITGRLSEVETSMKEIKDYLKEAFDVMPWEKKV